MIGDTATRVLLAVVNQRRPTVPSLVDELHKSKSTIHFHLMNLRRLGLVTWEHGKAGTLRPKVVERPFGIRYNDSGDQHRANGTGPLDTTAPSKRRDHAR